jgi:cobalt-zinc-cadmium efflux system membrane fusion protein
MKDIVIFFITALLLFSCAHEGHEHNPSSHTSAEEHVDMDPTKEIDLTHAQVRNIGITYEQIINRPLRTLVKLNGRVELLPGGRAIASSLIDGQVLKVHVAPGQSVREGQILFTVTNMELIDWQKTYLQDQATLAFVRKEIDRQRPLVQQEISPLKKLQELESQESVIQASLAALSSKLSLLGIQQDEDTEIIPEYAIRSPLSGIVQHINAYKGSFITPETELVEVIDDSKLRLHLFAFGHDMPFLSTGQELEFYVQSRSEITRQARVIWINNIMDTENNSYQVHADIIGEVRSFSPGEFVEAMITSKTEKVPAIPEEALAYDRGLTYIFIKEKMDSLGVHFQKKLVDTGVSEFGYTEIKPIDPLPEGAEIVTKGAFFLMAQSKKNEDTAGGHHH